MSNSLPRSGMALWICCALLATAQAQSPSAAAVASPRTLWNFLGIPQGVHKVQDAVVNHCGGLPGLERRQALKRIADPELANIDNAAIKKAQQIKAEEDLAPQKIKAIKYLATLGCEKCYGGIEEAMLESLKDCTEKVRYETVKALGEIPDKKCPLCDHDCCTEKITEQLAKMAYERDPDAPDCWYEPSARVRKKAKDTLKKCCCDGPPPVGGQPETPPATSPVEPPPAAPVEPPVERSTHRSRRDDQAEDIAAEPTPVEVVADDYDLTLSVFIAPRRTYDQRPAPAPFARSRGTVSIRPASDTIGSREPRRFQSAGPVRELRPSEYRLTPPDPPVRRHVVWGMPVEPERAPPRRVAQASYAPRMP